MSGDKPDTHPRHCILRKSDNFNGFGFNLHAEKGRAGQYIGKVDPGSPAENALLRQGDRIIEVDGVNIGNENHQQVVSRIKASGEKTSLLVVDSETDKYYKDNKIVINSSLPEVQTCDSDAVKTTIIDPEDGSTNIGETSQNGSVHHVEINGTSNLVNGYHSGQNGDAVHSTEQEEVQVEEVQADEVQAEEIKAEENDYVNTAPVELDAQNTEDHTEEVPQEVPQEVSQEVTRDETHEDAVDNTDDRDYVNVNEIEKTEVIAVQSTPPDSQDEGQEADDEVIDYTKDTPVENVEIERAPTPEPVVEVTQEISEPVDAVNSEPNGEPVEPHEIEHQENDEVRQPSPEPTPEPEPAQEPEPEQTPEPVTTEEPKPVEQPISNGPSGDFPALSAKEMKEKLQAKRKADIRSQKMDFRQKLSAFESI